MNTNKLHFGGLFLSLLIATSLWGLVPAKAETPMDLSSNNQQGSTRPNDFGTTDGLGSDSKKDYIAIFEEIGDGIEKHFYDAKFVEKQFGDIRKRYAAKVAAVRSQSQFAELVNAMLGELKSSHTHYYTPEDSAYYQLLSIFAVNPNIKPLLHGMPPLYPSIGVEVERRDNKYFVLSVFEGGPAAKAGIVKGDEIVSIDGEPFTPVESLRNRFGKVVTLLVRRQADAPPLPMKVTPTMADPQKEYLAAERASVQILNVGTKKIGYIHILSYANEEYHRVFIESLMGSLKDADALIWDLRDGWGGADPKYLNVFNKTVPVLSSTSRDGKENTYDPQWRKPVVMLVNGRVRSGKEVLAYAFKKHGIGKVIGEQTAGAVLAGTPFALSDGSILYLAVNKVRVDGDIMEGNGVKPDIAVPMDIRYSEGKDSQLQKAIDFFRETLQ
jgi:carboxyl-terminal processing protease